jgi:aryl-alcohol dehydrogenase-like predicted oxidoreductase
VSGAGFEVREESLEAAAEFQTAAAAQADRVSVTVREATAQGNLFGMMGQLAGLDATYRTWTEQEAEGLRDLSRLLDNLGAGLRQAAVNYRTAEETNGNVIGGVFP